MVTCPKCGKENPDGSLFCEECGAPLNDTENTEAVAATAEPEISSEEKEKPVNSDVIFAEAHDAGEELEKEKTLMFEVPSFLRKKDEEEPEEKEIETTGYVPQVSETPEPAAPVTPAPVVQETPAVSEPTKEELEQERKRAEKEAAREIRQKEKEERQKRKADIKAMPKQYRPIGIATYLFMNVLFFFLPIFVSAFLYIYFGANATNVLKGVYLMIGPVLSVLFLVFFSYAPKNENMRYYARSLAITLIIILVIGLVLHFTGTWETIITEIQNVF